MKEWSEVKKFIFSPLRDLVYLRLLRQRAGQVLRGEFSWACGGGLTVSLPKGRREGGVAGEERGSGETKKPFNSEIMLQATPEPPPPSHMLYVPSTEAASKLLVLVIQGLNCKTNKY